jgi:hypothetical protein
MQNLGVRPGVGHADRHQNVRRIALGVAHVDDPVAVVVEYPGVEQLVLGIEPASPAVLIEQVLVWKCALRVVVAPGVPGVAGDGVQEPPVLLDVLAVVSLGPGKTECPLLEDGVAAIPQRQRKTQPLLDVAEARQPVLAPPVRPRARVVMRQVAPRIPIGTVVLSNCAPLTFAQVRAPQIPVAGLPQALVKSAEAVNPLPFRAWCHDCIVTPDATRRHCARRQHHSLINVPGYTAQHSGRVRVRGAGLRCRNPVGLGRS